MKEREGGYELKKGDGERGMDQRKGEERKREKEKVKGERFKDGMKEGKKKNLNLSLKFWGSFNGCISLLRLSQLGIHNIIHF